MRFISGRMHGALDYAVAVVLVAVPLALGFAESSHAAAVVAIAAGAALFVYSLLTDYAAGLRRLIPFRVHLVVDAIAALALLATPFVFDFGGVARVFYASVGVAVLGVVACTQPGPRRTGAASRRDAPPAVA